MTSPAPHPGQPTAIVYADSDDLAAATAARFCLAVADTQAHRHLVHIAIAGGSVGTTVLGAVAASPLAHLVDWSGVHFWWVDERFVAAGSADRNDAATDAVLFGPVGIPEDNLHRMPSTDVAATVVEASARYAETLARFAPGSATMPVFDLVLLGMGPDGHIASLFPGDASTLAHVDLREDGSPEVTTLSISDSPKPPPQRVTLTLPAVNHAARVWVAAWGEGKAEAVARALAGVPVDQIPAAGVRGRTETLWLLDAACAGHGAQ